MPTNKPNTSIFEARPSLAPFRRLASPADVRLRKAAWLSAVAGTGALYGFLVAVLPMSFYLYLAAPIIALGLMVLWTLPETGAAPERAVTLLFFSYLAIFFLWPNYLAIAIPGLPWITLVRIVSVPLLLCWLYGLSVSPDFRRRVFQPFRSSKSLLRLMLAFLVIQILTLPLSDHLADSLNKFIDSQIQWTLIFFLSVFIFSKSENAVRWAIFLCFIAVFLCILAVFEKRNGGVLWAAHIPSFLTVPDESVQRILAGGRRAALNIHRLQATFSTSLNFAEYLGLCTPLFLYFFLNGSRLIKVVSALSLGLIFHTIVGTDSRLGFVAFLASFLIYTLLHSWKLWLTRHQNPFPVLVVLSYPAFAVLVLILTFVWQRLNRMVWGGGAQQASNEAREQQWANAIPKIMEMPIGHGIGESALVLGHRNAGGVLTIDSYYLTIALEYGVLGFIAYYGLMLAGAAQAVRMGLRSDTREGSLLLAAAVILLVFVIGKAVLSQDDSHTLVFMTLGLVVALVHRLKSQRCEPGSSASRLGT